MKTINGKQAGLIATLFAAGVLMVGLLVHLSSRPNQSCARETFESVSLIKLI